MILSLVFIIGCIEKNNDNESYKKPTITKDTILDQVVLYGLLLDSNEEIIYNETELIIRGNIDIKDNASLTIKNSKVIIDQEYNKQYMLTVKDNATFIVDNIYYESIDWRWFNWEYLGNATIHIEDFGNDQEPWQAIEGNVNAEFIRAPAGLTIAAIGDDGKEFNGSIFIRESDKVYFEVNLKPGENYEFEFPNGFIEEWHPNYFSGSIDIYNSTITDIDIDLWPGVNVTVKNTDHFAVGWIFGDGFGRGHSEGDSAEIIGLKNIYYDDFIVKANNATLRIINTTLTSWWPLVTGEFELTVRDSHMIDPWAFNEAEFNIYDSYIFYMSARNNATVRIYNSEIEDSLVALEGSRIELFDTEFFGTTTIDPQAEIFIDGIQVE